MKDVRKPNLQLRNARLSHGWSQKELAMALGTNSTSISRWESGYHTPSYFYKQRLSTLFNISLQQLGLFTPDIRSC